jgi:hypothetical protein
MQTDGLRFLFKPWDDGSWYCHMVEYNLYLEWEINDGWVFDCSDYQGRNTELTLLIKSVWKNSFGDRYYYETDIEQMKQDVEMMMKRIDNMSGFL